MSDQPQAPHPDDVPEDRQGTVYYEFFQGGNPEDYSQQEARENSINEIMQLRGFELAGGAFDSTVDAPLEKGSEGCYMLEFVSPRAYSDEQWSLLTPELTSQLGFPVYASAGWV